MKLRSRKPATKRQSYASWRDSVPDRPSRPRKRKNGRLDPIRNSASARNAAGRAVIIRHGGESEALRLGRFDMRSALGKRFAARVAELKQHLGGDLTVPQMALVDQAARLALLRAAAWDEIVERGAIERGDLRSIVDGYRRLCSDEREILRVLGLQRASREVPDLDDYLRSKGKRPGFRIARPSGPVEDVQ